MPSVEECNNDDCREICNIYNYADNKEGAIPYCEKAVTLGDNDISWQLGYFYLESNDYFNAKKYFEIACNKFSDNDELRKGTSCYELGVMYAKGRGVRQDYHKAAELYKKACDIKKALACNNLGFLYDEGLGVRQNLSLAKQYYGKACDLGNQIGCDNYKSLHSQGVQ